MNKRTSLFVGFLCLFICQFSYSQEEVTTTKHQHFVSATIMGPRNHLAVGYAYKFIPNDWFKLGLGASIGGFFATGSWFKYGSDLTLLPTIFMNFGKKWGWAEIGFTQNTSINFWRINNSANTNTEPVQSFYAINVGPTFSFGKSTRHEIGAHYYYNFTWDKVSEIAQPTIGKDKIYNDQHWFGFIYRFKFK